MDGYFLPFLAIAWLLVGVLAHAQTPQIATSPLPSCPPPNSGGPKLPDRIQQKYEKMSDEERARFMENFKRWQQLPEEEKSRLRDRAMMESERIQNAIKEAIAKSGLTLDDDQREVFTLRYIQERRKIERQLHHEMEMKRDQMLESMVEKLKVEFQSPATNAKGPEKKTISPAANP